MKSLLTLAIIAFSTAVYGQQIATNSISVSKNIPMSEWATYLETSEVKIEYKKADCYPNSGLDFQSILLRFTNKTSDSISLSWHINLDYDGSCKTCDSDEYDRNMLMEASQVLEGSCSNESGMKLELFSKFIDPIYTKGAQLTGFKLSNFELL